MSTPSVDPPSSALAAAAELRAHIERVLSPHYELDVEIGRGGMGVVYRARDKRLKRTVAIKVLPPELAFQSQIRMRFLREAETAAQLSHPHIVPIYTVDEAESLVFFVMAYVSGDNLAKRLHDSGVLSVGDVRRVTREVADALAYAHERGVVHRDIKPDNILLDAATGRTMVTDFGIARAVSEGDSRLTATGIAIGTPAYMSPEQAAGDRHVDGRSDLYSLGVVSYQMLVGEPPFVASSTPAMLVKHISERPTPVGQRRGDVPSDLARAVMLCLEKDPANRFADAPSLVAALDTGIVPEPRPRSELENAAVVAAAQSPVSASSYGYDPDDRPLTAEELRRQEAPMVVAFRKKLAPYLFVNAVIILGSMFGRVNFMGVTVVWSIYMAFKYARLWSEGYDWRDVFRQSREKELIDVADEFMEHVRALFNRDKRRELRDRNRARRARRSGAIDAPTGQRALHAQSVSNAAGPHADRVRQAVVDRDEIIHLVESMPKRERGRVTHVVRSADLLRDRVQGLAIALAELDRNAGTGNVSHIDQEISRLEDQANPLDAGSEDRVRRLATLRRQRRAAAEVVGRRSAVAAKLDTCIIALRNIKLDVLRLRAGSQSHEHVTSLALEAISLAESVDDALAVADEMSRVLESPGAAASRSPGRG